MEVIEESVSPEEDFRGRLSSVSSLNLEDGEKEADELDSSRELTLSEVVLLKSLSPEDPGESHAGYSPVSSERKSDSEDVEEGEIFPPVQPVASSVVVSGSKRGSRPQSKERVSRHRKKRKKEPLDVEISKQQQQLQLSKHTDLPRYDVRNIIKFKKKKRLSLRRSSPERHRRRSPSPRSPPPSRRRRNSSSSASSKRRRRRSKTPPKIKRRKKTPPPSSNTSPIKKNTSLTKKKAAPAAKTSKKTAKKSSSSSSKNSFKNSAAITIVNSRTSSVAAKEVFTEGDKIMVSVNFKPSRVKKPIAAPPPSASMDDDLEALERRPRGEDPSSAKEDKKPLVVIDVMSSPYLVIEPSPHETIDILSDEEGGSSNNNNTTTNNNNTSGPASSSSGAIITHIKNVSLPPPAVSTSGGPPVSSNSSSSSVIHLSNSSSSSNSHPISSSTNGVQSTASPPPLQSTAASSSSSGLLPPALLDILQHHRGPCTPPPPTTIQESIDVPKGPQTPPSDHSYDPCNPTLSPNINEEDTEQHENGEHIRNNNNGVVSSSNWTDSPEEDKETQQPPTSSSSSIPIIPFFDSSSYTNNATSSHAEKKEGLSGKDLEGSAVDMDMDSPFSPQSSDMSDIFEPPLNTPLTNKLILKRNKGKTGKPKKQSNNNNNNNNNHKNSSKNMHSKSVQMKLIDDKLRIVDDVPTSAVEMAVKEKFLKKVQRQERIVEEIKMVLKPYYNRKKIDKDAYKEILRKCVPKVCHSKNGEINPIKIQKLVKGYIKKYKYHSKKKSGGKGIKG